MRLRPTPRSADRAGSPALVSGKREDRGVGQRLSRISLREPPAQKHAHSSGLNPAPTSANRKGDGLLSIRRHTIYLTPPPRAVFYSLSYRLFMRGGSHV